jgi:hypothetical protein
MPDEAGNYLVNPYVSPGQMNLVPLDLKVREEAQEQKFFDDYPDAGLDFDGDPHERVRMGAYSVGKDRPRWFPTLEMKPLFP